MSDKKNKSPKQKYVIKKEVQSKDLKRGDSLKITVGAPTLKEVKDLFKFAEGGENTNE